MQIFTFLVRSTEKKDNMWKWRVIKVYSMAGMLCIVEDEKGQEVYVFY